MPAPSDSYQLSFLAKVQRLLQDGSFSSTYKHALLLALAELSIERGDDEGSRLPLTARDLAEKFLEQYWDHLRLYSPHGATEGGRIWQNSSGRAAVANVVSDCRARYGGSIARFRRASAEWERRVGEVAQIVRKMPLWRLQHVGGRTDAFLYPQVGRGSRLELRGEAAFCLRRFYPLIRELVVSAWIRQLRRFSRNRTLLLAKDDLREFLFGAQRRDLSGIRGVLIDLQDGCCFYCRGALAPGAPVDHFVPWGRYPMDLAHNLVAADAKCNSRKSDFLAAVGHLHRWCERNAEHGVVITSAAAGAGVAADVATTLRVARWAYDQVADLGGLTWLRGRTASEQLDDSWRELLGAA